MIGYTISSHNLQSKFTVFEEELNRFIGERPLNIACLQDVGYIGPDGPVSWKDHANTSHIFTNYSTVNKSRNVAILVGAEWDVTKVEKDKGGGLLAVTLHHELMTVKVINAYLPPGLDNYGIPDSRPIENSQMASRQREALDSYQTISDWTLDTPNWILLGDLNETRDEKLDRSSGTDRQKSPCKRPKFIDNFLANTEGVDMWRTLHPNNPNGHTRTDPVSRGTARLDYVILSPQFYADKDWQKQMWLGGQDPHSDHQTLFLGITLPMKSNSYSIRPWSTRRPRIPEESEERKQVVFEINQKWRMARGSKPPSDDLSMELALFMVQETGNRFGFIGGYARNKVHANKDSAIINRQINAIKRIGEYLRSSEGSQEPRLWELIVHYLKVLNRFQKITIFPPSTEDQVREWYAKEALDLLRSLREESRKNELSISNRYREAEHKQFLDITQRSKWLASVGLGKQVEPPPRWISNSEDEKIVQNPKEVKDLYLRSGAPLLQKKRELNTDLGGVPRNPEPPEITKRPFASEEQKIQDRKPAWWDKMYDRKAKGIEAQMWSSLMKEISASELREMISKSESDKAPGYDGTSIGLIKLLTLSEETAILETLTELINAAIRKGESWRSWRKSIISMIPKKKSDGSLTTKVEDMRPISVMQEFAKLTSKIFANRIGLVLLESPQLLNRAQRAFLRNGCINQCIQMALNVFEDFRERLRSNNKAQLYIIAYDQQKAYDCIQKYTIRASLERFNLPESFIRYVESYLEDATSCFKTFYGPTDDFPVLTSVRQGDPLSPLVYIFITDALHEGLKYNPVGGHNAGGYRFLNDHQLRATSSGYADDMLVYAQSWKGIWEMHQWVREFCLAHHWNINVDKCEFIISDCIGENDTRWLYSVDGRTPLRPKSPDTTFRYLGVWISMDLQWEKQEKQLHKCIMSWRSAIVRNKVNSVKTLTTVRDFLFPKMELGMQFAEINERTYKNWTKTIIHTILESSGISAQFARSINSDAFCSLANIPDLWRRTNTIRMTELLIALNTEHCDSGRSTRARVAAITHPTNPEWRSSLELISANKRLRKGVRKLNRHVHTLQYWKKYEVTLVPNPQQPNPLREKTYLLNTCILSHQPSELKIFTDGSTAARSTKPNSGIGVAVYDEKSTLIWQGGAGVRTDGNNFVAEMAAAALALEASPKNIPIQLYMDSTSAIQAIRKGSLSERRNVRSAARRWTNLAREAIRERQAELHIQHVRSHQGQETFEEKGNDLVDKIANVERQKTEDDDPIPYFTEGDIKILLKHQETIVQQDPRVFLKKQELAAMADSWKKLTRQSDTLRRHPNTLIQMEKKVFRWACQENNGHMWTFFILSALQWLPTKSRKLKGQLEKDVTCRLCLQLQEDDMSHMLVCPALEASHTAVEDVFQKYLEKWKVVPTGTVYTDKEVKTTKWARQARTLLEEKFAHIPIPTFRVLKSLAEGAYNVEHKRGAAPFLLEMERVMLRVSKETILKEELLTCGKIPSSLTEIFQRKLSLQVDILTDAIHKSELPVWYSQFQSDIWVGGKAFPLEQPLEGLNMLFNPPASTWLNNGTLAVYRFIDKLCETRNSEKPTRALLILPELMKDGKSTDHAEYARSKKFLEILKFPSGTFRFEDPSGYSLDTPRLMAPFQGQVSIFLFLNSRSLLFDPLDWQDFECTLNDWTSTNCLAGEIPQRTRQKFSERQQKTHPPRRYLRDEKKVKVIGLMKCCPKADSTLLRKQVHNGPLLKLITKVNTGDKGAATLGLFPHALKKLVCDKYPEGAELLEELSRDIIGTCARRFWQYQTLSAQAEKYRQGDDKQNRYNCFDPFHFLEPVADQKMALRSTCICDLRARKKRKSRNDKKQGGGRKKQGKKKHKPPQAPEDTTGKHSGDLHHRQKGKALIQSGIQSFLVPCPGVT